MSKAECGLCETSEPSEPKAPTVNKIQSGLGSTFRASRLATVLLAALICSHSDVAFGETLSSPSFQLLASRPVGAVSRGLSFAGGSTFGSTGYSLGQLSVTGFSGASTGLVTTANGVWPIVLGGFPNIDPDGDLISSPFDDDDDGDGLLDVVETGSGVFVSAGDTGSSPVLTDTDGDGFDDPTEVAEGSDPNDAGSLPAALVPLFGGVGLVLLFLMLGIVGNESRPTRMEIS